ncbi:hypothetical protein PSACC_03579 [Paramicrosporidium saccamoebae]|uniref:Uncharacterized protein n=1 Tax=Paramicrosporidium saccamoebae TaxID=1246581 RepID=A0A2H9TFR7_9FUNG|nr:hypothetical protein PSACC_03579 [Paramicrosporidium saccamoebae]
MTWSRKRKAVSSAAKVEELLTNNMQESVQLPDLLSTKLSSGQRDEQMQACALLASLEMESLLGKSDILPRLLGCINGGDAVVAAEAASVLRIWSSGNARLLYAHCVLPRMIQLLPACLTTLERISELEKSDVQVFEHFLVSLLLVIWSFVEEVPAAINQINDSPVVSLSCLILERASFLEEETIVVMLQLLLCASEENQEKLYANAADRVRLEALLQRRTGNLDCHSAILSFGLLSVISSECTCENVLQLFSVVEREVSLEMLRDLLEMLTNFISEVEFESFQDHFANILLAKLAANPEATEVMNRGQGCLMNLILAQPAALSVEAKQNIWTWALCEALPTAASAVSAIDPTNPASAINAANTTSTLAGTCELLRNLLLCSLGEHELKYTMEDIGRLQQICNANIANDSIVANLASIPAILCKEIDVPWLYSTVYSLFDKSRPLRTILAVAEIIEELTNRDAIETSLRNVLKSRRPSVIESCASEMATAGNDEFDYIVSVLDAALND